MLKFIKLSAKQKAAFKSWVHAAIATEVVALVDFLKQVHKGLTFKEFLIAGGLALLAPITRQIATVYSTYAIKYPWLKPLAAYLAKHEAKKIASVKSHLNTPIPNTKP